MIQNQRQYNVTKGQMSKLEAALNSALQNRQEYGPRVFRAMVAGIESHIDELRKQLQEFDELRSATSLRLGSVAEVGRVMIQARIARGYTQKDLGARLGIQEQQIQKYEQSEYRSANYGRILEVMKALDLDFNAEIPLRPSEQDRAHDAPPPGQRLMIGRRSSSSPGPSTITTPPRAQRLMIGRKGRQ